MYNNNVAAAHRRSSCPDIGAAAQLIGGENLTAQAAQLVAYVRPWGGGNLTCDTVGYGRARVVKI